MSKFVRIMEVGPRDGLQNESVFVPTEQKIAFIEALADAGLKRIEATAFVSKRWIPPLADHAELSAKLPRKPGVSYAALVPNLKGYQQAKAFKYNEISLVLAATQGHNRHNLNASTEEAFARYEEVIVHANADQIPFRAYISCAFGCPYEGKTPISTVLEWSRKFYNLGAYELSISDTIGVGTPEQTRELVNALLAEFEPNRLALHLHDTNGRALENIEVALDLGLRSFDSSAGGIGGCPYAPGAKGNVETERVVQRLSELGFETGVDLGKLKTIGSKIGLPALHVHLPNSSH